MPAAGTSICTDPSDYQAGFRGAKINLAFACPGDFHARLTWLDLPNLRLLSCQEILPRIAYLSLMSKQVFVSFAMHSDQPPICGGIGLQSGDMVFHSRNRYMHQRTNGETQWAILSIAPKFLAGHGKAVVGPAFSLPRDGSIFRPPATASADLRRLCAKACRLAENNPDIIANGEAARALEQELLHALVKCLMVEDVYGCSAATRHHASIMVRFETVLAEHTTCQLQIPELCAAVGVLERTLRDCCAETLGMGPSQYMRLRRLNMVRIALRHPDVNGTSVGKVAERYGFTELGRFAVLYRSTFGETPSTTLRHSPVLMNKAMSAEFA